MIKKNTGPLFLLLAGMLWSIAGVCSKFVPWSSMSVACLRGLIGAVTLGFLRRKWTFTASRSTILAALSMSLTTVLFMLALKRTTAANAVVLQYTAPIYVIIFSIIVFKVKPRIIDIVTVVFTFLGIALFFIDHLGHGAIIGDVFALISGVTFSGVFIFNSMPDANPQDSSYLGCLASILLIPFVFFDKALFISGTLPWVVIFIMGIFQLGLAYFLFAKGLKTTSPVAASIICSVEPILNPVWVFIAVNERPGALSLLGGAIVIIVICVYNVIESKRVQAYKDSAELV